MQTGSEIIRRALHKEETDRLPCFPLIDIAFASTYTQKPMREVQLNPLLHAESLSVCALELPIDGIYINLCLASGQPRKLSESVYCIDNAITLVIPDNDVLSASGTDVVSLEDERLKTAALYHPGILETFNLIPEEIKDRYAVAAGVTGTFSQVAFLYGISELMMALLDRPTEVHRALETRHSVVIDQVRELCAAGADLIWIGEGLGSGSLISPEQYRRFVLPYEQSLAGEISRCGASSILHICGDVTAALPDIAGCGADGFDLDFPVDLETARDILLPSVAVKGNLDPRLFLMGNRENLEDSCRNAVRVMRGRNGFILSTGCLVPRDSAVEAFQIVAGFRTIQ